MAWADYGTRLVAIGLSLVAAALFASCVVIEQSRTPVEVTVQAEPRDDELLAMEHEVEEMINDLREEHGVEHLERDEEAAAVARAYSCRMADNDFFAHEAPEGDNVGDRVHAAGIRYRQVGENLAMMTGMRDPGTAAVDGWMDSDGHRENMLHDEYTHGGVGICAREHSVYFTHILVLPR